MYACIHACMCVCVCVFVCACVFVSLCGHECVVEMCLFGIYMCEYVFVVCMCVYVCVCVHVCVFVCVCECICTYVCVCVCVCFAVCVQVVFVADNGAGAITTTFPAAAKNSLCDGEWHTIRGIFPLLAFDMSLHKDTPTPPPDTHTHTHTHTKEHGDINSTVSLVAFANSKLAAGSVLLF